MASTNVSRLTEAGPPIPAMGSLSCAANQFFAPGTIIQKDANGRAVSPATADVSALPAFMIASSLTDNRTGTTQFPNTGLNDGAIVEGVFGSNAFALSGTAPVEGQTVFVVDNQTFSIDSLNGTRGVLGVCVQVQVYSATVTKYFILVGPLALAFALASNGAYARMNLPITSGLVTATGAPMALSAAGGVAGTAIADAKSAVVKWFPNATPGGVSINIAYPPDMDPTKPIVFKAELSKSGATVGDACTLTVAAFDVAPGALDDAVANFGGVTSAIVGNATAKTVTTVSLSMVAAATHAYPNTLALSITPTAGTLGTDNLHMHSAYLEYTKKPV